MQRHIQDHHLNLLTPSRIHLLVMNPSDPNTHQTIIHPSTLPRIIHS